MTSKIIVNTIEADTGISSITFASNINLQNDASVLVSSNGVRLGTGSTIAAPSANEITLSTNGTERVRVDSSGNVGIGTDNPEYNLDLGQLSSSTIRLISENNGTAIRVGSGGDSNDVTLLRVDGTSTGVRYQGESDVGGLGFSIKYMGSRFGNNNSLAIFGDNGFSDGAGSQVEAITVLQDGKIGIGTDNPQGIVHISSGTSGDATLILEADTDNNDESDNPNIIFRQDGGLNLGSIGMNFTNSSLIGPSNELYVAASSTNAAIVFATGTSNGYTNATERLRITSGGNIGIGTENPAEKLEIRDGGLLINESNLTGIFTGDVADDTFVSIDLTQPGFIAGGLFLITTNSGATNAGVFPQAIGTGLVYYDCGNSLAGARILADADAGGSALLGGTTSTSTTITDFTDGRVTIICNTNTLRIANRTGGNRRFKLTFV